MSIDAEELVKKIYIIGHCESPKNAFLDVNKDSPLKDVTAIISEVTNFFMDNSPKKLNLLDHIFKMMFPESSKLHALTKPSPTRKKLINQFIGNGKR